VGERCDLFAIQTRDERVERRADLRTQRVVQLFNLLQLFER